MNKNKDFKIYDYGKFQNRDKLNACGKVLYTAFEILKNRNEKYFKKISYIKITSQDRTDNQASAHFKEGKACDIVISPAYVMPYYAGLLHAILPLNIYLGMFIQTDSGIESNKHIHTDADYTKRKNTFFFEGADRKLYLFNKNNVDLTLKVYGFNALNYLDDFGKFKKDTIKFLLTDLSEADKKTIKDLTPTQASELYLDTEKKIKDAGAKIAAGAKITGLIGLAATGFMIYSFIKKRL